MDIRQNKGSVSYHTPRNPPDSKTVCNRWYGIGPGAEFVARIEDILDVYRRPYDPPRPVVCPNGRPSGWVQKKTAPAMDTREVPFGSSTVELISGSPVVIRLKNEAGVTLDLIESQSRFADTLCKNGVLTPRQHRSGGFFAKQRQINGYDVIVTVEDFVEHELKTVDAVTAEKTGQLLEQMRSISERCDLHARNGVLFDPFAQNDLFDVESFRFLEPAFSGYEKTLFDQILQWYHSYLNALAPLKRRPWHAVQGDISSCNLYQTVSGQLGVFDFNRCGDNNLFCDAVMRAVFEARLMDYPGDKGDFVRPDILEAFLKGDRSARDFTEEEQNWYPYLYAIINAFWSADIRWSEDSLMNAVKHGDMEGAGRWLERIWRHLTLQTQ